MEWMSGGISRGAQWSLLVANICMWGVLALYSDGLVGAVGLHKYYYDLLLPVSLLILIIAGISIKRWNRAIPVKYARFNWLYLVGSCAIPLLLLQILGSFLYLFLLPVVLIGVLCLVALPIFIIGIHIFRPRLQFMLFMIFLPIMYMYISGISSRYFPAIPGRTIYIRDDIKAGNRVYFLEAELTASDGDILRLYECNENGIRCDLIHTTRSAYRYFGNSSVHLEVSDDAKLSIFADGESIFDYMNE